MVKLFRVLLSPVWFAIATARSLPSTIGAFSTPEAVAVHVTVGAAGSTVTTSLAVPVVLISPLPSFSVAVAVRVKLPSGTVAWLVSTVRLDSVQPLTSIGVLPSLVMVWARVPSLRIAPSGTPLMVRVFSVLLSPAWLAIAIARSLPSTIGAFSTPEAVAVHVTVGTAGSTVTTSLAVPVVLMSPLPSCSVAVAVRVKLPSGTVAWLVSTVRLDRFQPLTSIGVLPSLAMVWAMVPSLRIAPSGTPLMVKVFSALLSPAWLAIATARSLPSTIGAFSTPDAVAVHVTVGAAGSTVTTSLAVPVVLISPLPSFSVAVAVRVKFASLVGATVRLDSVQPLTSIGVLPSLMTLLP